MNGEFDDGFDFGPGFLGQDPLCEGPLGQGDGVLGDPLADPLGSFPSSSLANPLDDFSLSETAAGYDCCGVFPGGELSAPGEGFTVAGDGMDGHGLLHQGSSMDFENEVMFMDDEGSPAGMMQPPGWNEDGALEPHDLNAPDDTAEPWHEEAGMSQAPGHPLNEAGMDIWQYYELLEESLFISEHARHRDWMEDARMNRMLESLEDSMEGIEERPFYPRPGSDEPVFNEERGAVRANPAPERRKGSGGERRGRPWIEPPVRAWRPRPSKMTRGAAGKMIRKLALRMVKEHAKRFPEACPVLRGEVQEGECLECEFFNAHAALYDDGEDVCLHSGYYAFLKEWNERILQGPDTGDE